LTKLIIYAINIIKINNTIKLNDKSKGDNLKVKDWQDLTRVTQGAPLIIERVRLADSGIAVEGEFELPPLAKLPAEEQVFIMAFIKSDGSIKEMERIFGISYPTVKSRLSRIAGQLQFVENLTVPRKEEILAALERGEITPGEAIERLSQ
jgi:hypothetical protein